MKKAFKTYIIFIFQMHLDYLLFNYYSIFILYIMSCPS